jgi:hypothetical protein
MAKLGPDLADEGGDRGLAVGAGDGGDDAGLAGVEAGSQTREVEARVA